MGSYSSRTRRSIAGAVIVMALLGLGTLPAANAAEPGCPTGDLSFSSDLSNGSFTIGKTAKSTGNSAHACGVINASATGLTATIQPGDIHFAPGTTKILILSLPTTLAATGPITGPVEITPEGSFDVSLTGPIQAKAALGPFSCTIGPITTMLTTGASGSLHGTAFVPDASGTLTGRLVSNDFTVPAVKASPTCPFLIAALTNVLVGLPSAAGKSSISFDGSIQPT
jgi:hypothetical protein